MLFWVGLIMVGLTLAILLAALRRAPGAAGTLWAGTRWRKIILVVAALVGYAYALERLGFFLTTVLVLIFLFKAIEPQRWTVAVAGAVLTALAAYGLFSLWLGAQLPRGALFG
jgi:putative tricarboxylic transport membrane protein